MATAVSRVAVVDDEAPVRTALSRLLRLADFDVGTFASGEEFLASLETRRPDCVILDMHMPGLSGFDVQSRMRAAHVFVPVIFITASDETDLERRILESGSTWLLRKPFSNAKLLAAIETALQAKPIGA